MAFEIKKISARAFSLSGQADETADFSPILAQGEGICALDVGDIASMNSKGVKQWIEFIKAAKNLRIRLTRVPAFFILYANQIGGFFTENVSVESFYVPYFAATSDQNEPILFSRGKNFDAGSVYLPAVMRSEVTGDVLEIDVRPENYFRFLGALKIVSK